MAAAKKKSSAAPAAAKPAAGVRKRAAPKAAAPVLVEPVVATPKAAGGPKAGSADKPRKIKILRDSFTIPKSEYAVLAALKERAAQAGRPARKSEVLRAGVKALAAMGDGAFLDALGSVPTVKTGRPAKG